MAARVALDVTPQPFRDGQEPPSGGAPAVCAHAQLAPAAGLSLGAGELVQPAG